MINITAEQIEEYIRCSDLNLGPECCEPWVDVVREHIRKLLTQCAGSGDPVYQVAAGGAWMDTDKDHYDGYVPQYRRTLYTAPQPQSDNDHHARVENAEAVQALADMEDKLAAMLPGPYYMGPPDGGSVTVLEQVRCMSEDAARLDTLLQTCTESRVSFNRQGVPTTLKMTFKNSVETSVGYRKELRTLFDDFKKGCTK